MTELCSCMLPKMQHEKRKKEHLETGILLRNSEESFDYSSCENLYAFASCSLSGIPMAIDYYAKDFPFGPVNTLANAGSISFVTNYILREYGKNIDICNWTLEIVQKGYRIWCFSNYPKITFSSPKVDISEVKNRFKGIVPDTQNCTSIGELQRILGNLEGIGGSMYLVDNVICMLANKKLSLQETRLNSIDGIISNIQNGIFVPIRVNNSIYMNDEFKIGGHYIIIIGIKHNTAYVLDFSSGIKSLPLKQLLKAAVHETDLIAAWNLSVI